MRPTDGPETRAQLGFAGPPANASAVPARFLSTEKIAACDSYRTACVMAWENRSNPHLLKRSLAELCGLHAPHVTDYFHPSATDAKGGGRRSLPAEHIHEVERILGNRAISQYLARRGMLTLMEEIIATRNV